MMTALGRIHHVAVAVPDIAVARRFYVDLLGGTEVSALEWPAGTAFIDTIIGLVDCAGKQMLVRVGNAYVEVFEFLSPTAPPQDPERPVHHHGYTHFAVQVNDIDLVYARMVEAGIRFNSRPQHSGGAESDADGKLGFRAVYGRDFFGNVFELIEISRDSLIAPL